MSNTEPYQLERRIVLAETPTLRVSELTLGPGQAVPWHYHGEVTDTFLCMEGPMVIETQGGRTKTGLNPGERHVIPPRTAGNGPVHKDSFFPRKNFYLDLQVGIPT